jgi:hypothetical protein
MTGREFFGRIGLETREQRRTNVGETTLTWT